MKHYSIRIRLIILFTLTFFFVCILFVALLKIEERIYTDEESVKQKNLIKNLLDYYALYGDLDISIEPYLRRSGFSMMKDEKLVEELKSKSELVFMANKESCILSSLKYAHYLYLDVYCGSFQGFFKQERGHRFNVFLIISFLFFSFLIIFIYFSVLRSLEPLKQLRRQILLISNGERQNFDNYEDDEIGKIAFEFDKAFKKNQELIESRQLFLRTIMHELKTPIGKGRIIVEMIKEAKQKDRLIEIFKRLDSLINEFAKIEHLFSKNYNLRFELIPFSLILNGAKKFLMRDDFEKVVRVKFHEDGIMKVDVEVFSLALKNLLDNALKYSQDGTCELECGKNYFMIKNYGQTLKEPVEYYFQAFTREKHTQVGGTGLGLYIVSEICKLHNFDLIYTYELGKHCFKVVFKK